MKHIILIIILSFLISCIRQITGSNFFNWDDSKSVSIDKLLKDKRKYHGKIIKTDGFYFCGIDHSSIQSYKIKVTDSTKNVNGWEQSVWVTFENSEFYYSCDKLNGKFISLIGYFDSTQHGFLSSYAAQLSNAVIIMH